MRTCLFVLILSTLLPKYSFGQGNHLIHKIRLGNIKSSVTTYNRMAWQEAAIPYDEILANPKVVCDMPNCEVTHFTVSIIPRGADLYGPFSTNGHELNEKVKSGLLELREAKNKAKIIFEDIQVNNNGKNETITGAMIYECK
jgi:hypothetical protein